MKRCKCLRYSALRSDRKDESVYVFLGGKLIPVDAIFPLEDFETGTGSLIPVCPYYNHIYEGRLVYRAFDRFMNRTLSRKDAKIINEAIDDCQYKIESKNYLIFSARNKEIISNFCDKYGLKLTWRFLKHFLSFLKVRGDFMDKRLCEGVSAQEKKKCFDDLWIEGFGRYLENVNFNID